MNARTKLPTAPPTPSSSRHPITTCSRSIKGSSRLRLIDNQYPAISSHLTTADAIRDGAALTPRDAEHRKPGCINLRWRRLIVAREAVFTELGDFIRQG